MFKYLLFLGHAIALLIEPRALYLPPTKTHSVSLILGIIYRKRLVVGPMVQTHFLPNSQKKEDEKPKIFANF